MRKAKEVENITRGRKHKNPIGEWGRKIGENNIGKADCNETIEALHVHFMRLDFI